MDSKDAVREEIWRIMRESGVARFPGAEGRIPNFIGAERAALRLGESRLWKKAKTIKVNPDSPQRAVRQRALQEGKTLYMPVPRLKDRKPFIELDPKKLKASPYQASSIKGADDYGRPVSLEEVQKIDLIVCGSVAVNMEGARVGKGGGYSDIEYALLREEGRVGARTPIVSTIHELQIRQGPLPMTGHDIPLTVLVTEHRTIILRTRYRKPKGIDWRELEPEKRESIPVLQERRISGTRDGQ